jgi:glutathione S-transferase
MSVTIYGMAVTRAGRCLWAAEELGIPYTHKPVDMFAGAHKAPAYLAVNPNGKVPAMQHDGVILFESLAINLYLADVFGRGGLAPDDAAGRGMAAQWSLWVATECETALLCGLLHTLGIMGFEKSAAKVAENRAKLDGPLGVLNQALSGREYLVGDRFTVADLNVASVFQWGQIAGMDWAPNGNVAAWLGRCLGRPAAQQVGQMPQAEMAKMKAGRPRPTS